MLADRFSHVRTWVFDLDNTLYPPRARIFDQIRERMTTWLMRELGLDRAAAGRLRQQYWAEYGTTLAGLMQVHGIDPAPYLREVHAVDLSALAPDPALDAAIGALPGRAIVHTNASRDYAERVLVARGLRGRFDAVYGVEETDFHPKPARRAFEAVLAADGLDPRFAAMFEDDPRNLAVPHEMGMQTVHVAPGPAAPAPHVHHHTADLAGFLAPLGAGAAGQVPRDNPRKTRI